MISRMILALLSVWTDVSAIMASKMIVGMVATIARAATPVLASHPRALVSRLWVVCMW